MTEHQQDAVN